MYILDINHIICIVSTEFFPFWRVLVNSVNCFYIVLQKLFDYMRSHLSTANIIFWVCGPLFRKLLPLPMSLIIPLVSSSNGFRVSGLTLRYYIHLKSIFLYKVTNMDLASSFDMGIFTSFSHSHLQKMLSFVQCIFFGIILVSKNSSGCGYVDPCPDHLFYWLTYLSCVYTGMLLLKWLCNITWNWL